MSEITGLLFSQPAIMVATESNGKFIKATGILAFGSSESGYVAYCTAPPDTEFPVEREDITVEENTGRIRFSAYGSQYSIREFRESDGRYISTYETSLPTEALVKILTSQQERNRAIYMNTAPTSDISPERLAAYSMDDSAYVLGLVYSVAGDRWVRIDDDWILMSPDDDTFSDMVVINIDPVKADEFIKFYDRNFVTVTTASKYEDTPPEFLPVSELPEDDAQPTETTPTETA